MLANKSNQSGLSPTKGNSRIGAPNSVARFIANSSWGENKFAVLERVKGDLVVRAAQKTYLGAKYYWRPGLLLVDLAQCWIVDGRDGEHGFGDSLALTKGNSPVLRLTIRTGESFNVYSDQSIERLDMPGTVFRNWKFLGIVPTNKRGFIPFSALLAGDIPEDFRFKNGNPKWTVRDLDHGTMREWGNTPHHGLIACSRLS